MKNKHENGYWTYKTIENELKQAIKEMNISRMPTGDELKNSNKYDLLNAISTTGGIKGWSKNLGLRTKGAALTRIKTVDWLQFDKLSLLGYNVENIAKKMDIPIENMYGFLENRNAGATIKPIVSKFKVELKDNVSFKLMNTLNGRLTDRRIKGKVIFINDTFFMVNTGKWRECFNWADYHCGNLKNVKINGQAI